MNIPKVDVALFPNREEASKVIQQTFACACESKRLTIRTLRNGSTALVHQCKRCGSASSNPVAKSATPGWGKLPQFDVSLDDGWHAAISAAHEEAHQHFKQVWRDGYSGYLESDAWRAKRALVLKRAGGVCEGCLSHKATQVHHLTYDHVGDELLFELVAICDNCHARVHVDREG